jgi:putative OPT family oligopeptide transporter
MSTLTSPPERLVTGVYREITVPAIALGVLLGALMTAAFVYIALKLGFSMPGSTVAAILGFGLLRGVLKTGTIVENNINQTVASGINNASAGVSFTLPALFLMSAEHPELANFDPIPFIIAAMAGTFMGVVVIIPLRKQMIEFERLRFPSGIAVAAILKSPGAGARQAKLLAWGFLIATAFTVAIQGEVGLIPEELSLNHLIPDIPAYFPLALSISFASIGAGLLSGMGGMPFVLGGVLAWWVIAPIAVSAGWVPTPAVTDLVTVDDWQSGVIYSAMLRPLGIGILVGGALAGVVASFPALRAAFKSLSAASKAGAIGGGSSDEMPSKVLYLGLGASAIALFLAAMLATDVSVGEAIAMAITGVVWLALAGLIVAQATGMTDISPLSGMALIAVTVIFFISSGNTTAAILIGLAVCMGIGQCGDMMTDLKSGHLIGAIPKRQQLAQFSVSWIGAPIAIGVVFLLWGAGPDGMNGFGTVESGLTAPQGQALASVINSLSAGDVALEKYVGGAIVGAGLSVFPLGGIGVLVGLAMYLPLAVTLTYGLGCLVSIWLARRKSQAWMGSTLVPIAAGFIVGEALTNLGASLVRLAAG